MPAALSSREERNKRDISAIILSDRSLRDCEDPFSPPCEKTLSLGFWDGLSNIIAPTVQTEQPLNAACRTNAPVGVMSKAHAVISVACDGVDNTSKGTTTQSPAKLSSILRRTRSKSADFATSRPKAVLFSDAMGLPLVHVRSFDDGLAHLGQAGRCDGDRFPRVVHVDLPFRFVGDQPCACADFLKRLQQQRVCLESLRVSGDRAVGCVQVANSHFEKRVSVRFTTDGWRTFSDVSADYAGSLGPEVDRFSFSLVLVQRNSVVLAARIMFAIRFAVDDAEYWDNNYGSNYRIDS